MKSELKKLMYFTVRNIKIYFKDKFTFFVSLITPLILLILFVTFLKSVYEDTILNIVGSLTLDKKLIDGLIGGWLISSVLATSCITVAFCSGITVLDKINKVNFDFAVCPVKKTTLQIGYVLANLVATIIICLVLLVIGLIYLAVVGFYLTFTDILLAVVNIVVTALFGTLLANIVWSFTNSQGAVSGVCTLVSAMYGFICGAYMPINMMGDAMKSVTASIPGTYSTLFFRQNFMNKVISEMGNVLPEQMVDAISESFDFKYVVFGNEIKPLSMFLILFSCTMIVLSVFIVIAALNLNKKEKLIKAKQKKN